MKLSQFEARKTDSLSHQLIKAGRLINQLGLRQARELFQLKDLTQTHLDLFPHIDFTGTSISEIAARKGVSKQAMSKLVSEMVSMGLLEVKTDTEDSRAKKVFFKTKGPFAIQKGFKALTKIDENLKTQLGNKNYRDITIYVTKILELLNEKS